MNSTKVPNSIDCALFAASGPYRASDRSKMLALLEGWGIRGHLAPGERTSGPLRHSQLNYLAGSDQQRLEELRWALSAPDISLAWAIRGGYGLGRLLPHLDFEELQPRSVLGFSDVTALQWALYRRGWRKLIHAPNAQNLILYRSPVTLAAAKAAAWGHSPQPWKVEVWQSGQVNAPMVGGNINVLAGLCGTPDQFVSHGHAVFLEEVRETPYRLDHNLTQMLRCGCFDGCRAIVLGQFFECGSPKLVESILRDRLQPLGVPLLAKAPAGHGNIFRPFLQGQPIELHHQHLHFLGSWD